MSKIKVIYETEEQTDLIEITRAEYAGGYRIHLWFNDGKNHVVDFEPFLRKARHPSLKKYLDENQFKKFKIVYGNLDWNDYELCFPVADLYEGRI